MNKKEEEESVYSIISVIDKPHICTWRERDGINGYSAAQYKVLIEDEDGDCLMVSALNDTDLADMASEGFPDAKEQMHPLDMNTITSITFNEMIKFNMEIGGYTPLESIQSAFHEIVAANASISNELSSYFDDLTKL